MSDVFLGPGWWLASDGKWYRPSQHPDAAYRESFASVETDEDTVVDEVADEAVAEGETAISETPSEDSAREDLSGVDAEVLQSDRSDQGGELDGSVSPLETIDGSAIETVDASSMDLAETPPVGESVEPPIVEGPATEEPDVAIEEVGAAEEPELILDLRDSATIAAKDVAPEPESEPPTVEGRTQLELKPSRPAEPERSLLSLNEDTEAQATTDVVHVPSAVSTRVDPIDVFFSALVFFGGLAVIGGAFLAWTVGEAGEIGWDRPDGVVVVAAGVIAATASGPMYAGMRVIARPVAIVAGIVALMVVGVVIVTTLTEAESTGLSLGIGIYVVLAGALAVIAGSAGLRINPDN